MDTVVLFRPTGETELALIRDGGKGFVLKFQVDRDYLSRYQVQTVGARIHREYWIPAEDLPEFNGNIIGTIEVVHRFESHAR